MIKMIIRIICINKDNGNHNNPHEAIQNFGWLEESTGKSGNLILLQMVDYLERGNQAYVISKYGNKKAYLMVQERNGRKYVQTYADSTLTDNLLELAECRV